MILGNGTNGIKFRAIDASNHDIKCNSLKLSDVNI